MSLQLNLKCIEIVSKMEKALKDLTTAHFTKIMLRMRNKQIFIFFDKIGLHPHFHSISGNNEGRFI